LRELFIKNIGTIQDPYDVSHDTNGRTLAVQLALLTTNKARGIFDQKTSGLAHAIVLDLKRYKSEILGPL